MNMVCYFVFVAFAASLECLPFCNAGAKLISVSMWCTCILNCESSEKFFLNFQKIFQIIFYFFTKFECWFFFPMSLSVIDWFMVLSGVLVSIIWSDNLKIIFFSALCCHSPRLASRWMWECARQLLVALRGLFAPASCSYSLLLAAIRTRRMWCRTFNIVFLQFAVRWFGVLVSSVFSSWFDRLVNWLIYFPPPPVPTVPRLLYVCIVWYLEVAKILFRYEFVWN